MRWKLLTPHYLNVPGTVWTQEEQPFATPKRIKREFKVPLYLNPEDPSQWTEKNEDRTFGWIVVCHEGKGKPSDTIFVGPPTPDMEPMDDEARELSKSYQSQWATFGDMPAGDFENSMFTFLTRAVDRLAANNIDTPETDRKQLESLMRANADLISENEVLRRKVGERSSFERARRI